MPTIHFLNVLEGDCNIIQHSSGRTTVIDVSNAFNEVFTEAELASKLSEKREERRYRTQVPSGKIDYQQKKNPDNPIEYIRDTLKLSSIFRFIISHPDMDHLDGIKDFFAEFSPANVWDTDNTKEIDLTTNFAGYNKDDWEFYLDIRSGRIVDTKRLTYFDSTKPCDFWNDDGISILAPSQTLLYQANESGNYNDASFVLLYQVKRNDGGVWKIVFSGDSDDDSWDHIMRNHSHKISDVDVLIAPHHGRDSGRDYSFLKILNPRVTLFGNASSKHLAYGCYPPIRITNNQAGYVVMDIDGDHMTFYVKNYDFARDFKANRNWSKPLYSAAFAAWDLLQLN